VALAVFATVNLGVQNQTVEHEGIVAEQPVDRSAELGTVPASGAPVQNDPRHASRVVVV
jgi:hypothetical protein